jgi:hypothetical protein
MPSPFGNWIDGAGRRADGGDPPACVLHVRNLAVRVHGSGLNDSPAFIEAVPDCSSPDRGCSQLSVAVILGNSVGQLSVRSEGQGARQRTWGSHRSEWHIVDR